MAAKVFVNGTLHPYVNWKGLKVGKAKQGNAAGNLVTYAQYFLQPFYRIFVACRSLDILKLHSAVENTLCRVNQILVSEARVGGQKSLGICHHLLGRWEGVADAATTALLTSDADGRIGQGTAGKPCRFCEIFTVPGTYIADYLSDPRYIVVLGNYEGKQRFPGLLLQYNDAPCLLGGTLQPFRVGAGYYILAYGLKVGVEPEISADRCLVFLAPLVVEDKLARPPLSDADNSAVCDRQIFYVAGLVDEPLVSERLAALQRIGKTAAAEIVNNRAFSAAVNFIFFAKHSLTLLQNNNLWCIILL